VLSSIISDGITVLNFFICSVVAIGLGIVTALLFTKGSSKTQSFALTLALLPLAIEIVIMLVNGNLGAGVAVAGAFSLVRFRSAPGTGKEISGIFIALVIGLSCGMGYIGIAVLFFILIAALTLVLEKVHFGAPKASERILKITIPESLNYEHLFDDLFEKYDLHASLEKVKTSNMGTMYELQYRILLPENVISKELMDEIRCRNGNLNIVCSQVESKEQSL
jgi:uncharacterized membrane protein YhiD involved in acid resistance